MVFGEGFFNTLRPLQSDQMRPQIPCDRQLILDYEVSNRGTAGHPIQRNVVHNCQLVYVQATGF